MRAVRQYEYASPEEGWSDEHIARRVLERLTGEPRPRTVLDAGCGNGSLAGRLAALGFEVCGFDASVSGIQHARSAYLDARFEVAGADDDLRALFGRTFDACVCMEVIEHLYDPRTFVRRVFEVLRPDGLFVLTTPYHGYLKNLALAITGAMDSHFTALWDGGHIKFWSRATLTSLLEENGFRVVGFEGAGRLPLLWKSMIVSARKG
jgi:2-polyprenyl-3-methyl-5-hydroxy-6-metoxy-1,4-benzoquinol methylase